MDEQIGLRQDVPATQWKENKPTARRQNGHFVSFVVDKHRYKRSVPFVCLTLWPWSWTFTV